MNIQALDYLIKYLVALEAPLAQPASSGGCLANLQTTPVITPSNGVMGVAKRLGTNPREFAQKVLTF
ncbi:hypothetical protein O9992_03780 [Vibrio lentus]|nr:hypothetical protein [Vibrio lentus]